MRGIEEVKTGPRWGRAISLLLRCSHSYWTPNPTACCSKHIASSDISGSFQGAREQVSGAAEAMGWN